MRRRAVFWLAWAIGGLSVAMFVAGVALYILARSAKETAGGGTAHALSDLLFFFFFLAFPVVGALIASKRPANPIGWLCLTVGLFWMAIILGEAHDAYELATTGEVAFSLKLDALTQMSWVPPVGLLGIYMILLFPDGKLPSRRWRPFAWFAGAVMVLICVGFIFVPGPLDGHPGVRNPFGLEQFPWLPGVSVWVVLLLPVCILVSALSLILRYRHSGSVVREQIKWLAFAASMVGVVYFASLISELLFAPNSLTTNETPLWVEIQRNLLLLSYAGVPVAVGIAILKYRLYGIEVIINRTLVYGLLTASLALVYVGCVFTLQFAFRALAGDQSQLVIVASTLVIAALFNPLRRRIQDFIDRRFYRRKYDAAKTLAAFSARMRDETDLEVLSSDLVSVVEETMQPAYVSLWLKETERAGGRR